MIKSLGNKGAEKIKKKFRDKKTTKNKEKLYRKTLKKNL